MKTRKLFVIFLLIFIFGCGYISVRTPFILSGNNYQEQSITEGKLRILSWNIHKNVNDINWENDFIKIVSEKNPNVILLQEVRLEMNIIKLFKDDLQMGWEFSPNLFQGKYDAYAGVMTASYIRPTMAKPALSSGTEPFTKIPKPVLFTRYNLGLAALEEWGLDMMSATDEPDKQKKINKFKDEKSKRTVLIVKVDTDTRKVWTIAMYNDEGEFVNKELTDAENNELAIELNKEEEDKDRILKLASSYLGLAPLELLIVNIHCINFKIDLNEFKEQIRYVAGEVMAHDGPVIMAGDFNTWSKNRLEHLDMIVKELELVKITFSSKSNYVKTAFGNPLDHIFISKEKLEVVKGSEDVIAAINSSDHKPLFVELRILQ